MEKIAKQVLIISTGQHVGKTTTCLGLMDHLQKKLVPQKKKLAYCKPVGQQHIPVGNDLLVDKDAYIFKDYFGLTHNYQDMSPVIFPSGFTRDYLDEKISSDDLKRDIHDAHQRLLQQSDFLVVEGTGHTGVGSICDINNAQVAAELKMDVICVALGGLGSSFDQLALNREMLVKEGVQLKGVILNKVNPEKMEMIKSYYTKALKRWNVPLLGCIPQLPTLCHPSMSDFSKLLKSKILSAHSERLRYFASVRLALAPVDSRNIFKEIPHQLVITHSHRHDVIDAILNNRENYLKVKGQDLFPGLILTGWDPPSTQLKEKLDAHKIPCIYVPKSTADSYTITARIANFTAKLNREDEPRLKEAIRHVCKHTDFSIFDV